jgi:hypothetical protein
MARTLGTALIAVVAILSALAAAPTATAQQGGILITDDNLSIDQDQLRKEHEALLKALTDDPQIATRSGLLKKTDYCLTCRGGTQASCTAPFGGETGKIWCASQCTYKCKSTCGVAAKAC